MGPGISSNYDQITYVFTSGCWKVHSAVSKMNNQRVCLWKIDPDLLSNYVIESMQTQYLQDLLNGIKIAQKNIHPRILKILQIDDKLSNLAFSSEPVSSCLTTLIGSLDVNDSSYISYQILDGLSFLHNGAKMLHLGLTPSAIFLNETLSVKIFNFNWSMSISSQVPISLPFSQFRIDHTMPDINYTAPEVVINRQGYPQSDIFSFCCILFEMLTSSKLRNIQYMNEFDPSVNPSSYALKIPEQFSSIFAQCLQSSPSQRPIVENLISQEPFQTIPIKVLRYLDLIIAKDPKDKFGFFKGLATAIHNFSPMMAKARILPILIAECKADPRFAPVLLGTIFSVSEKFTVREFTEDVFKNVSFLIALKDPPQITIALLQWISLILEKTDKSLHNDCVYPIIYNSLQSTNEQIQRECLKRLPAVVKLINETSVRSSLVPKLVDLCANTADDKIAASSIKSLAVCMTVSDNDGLLLDHFPRVFKSWKRHSGEPEASAAMYELISSLKKASNKNLMCRAMQVAAHVISAPGCQPHIQKKLCAWMANEIAVFRTEYNLDRIIDKPDEAELIALKPVKQKQLNPKSPQNSPGPSSPSKSFGGLKNELEMTSPLNAQNITGSNNNNNNLDFFNSTPSFAQNSFNAGLPGSTVNQLPGSTFSTGGLSLNPLTPPKNNNNDDILNLF